MNPPSYRIGVDVAAVGVGAAHWLGWWKDNAGTFAATAGLVWILIQASFYLRDRYKKRK